MEQWNYDKPWYHGSPLILEELLVGSTITQDKELARIFSHKPTIVAKDEAGQVFHNGKLNGHLYIVDEPITSEDVYPHPNSTMGPGEEWLITRQLKVRKIDTTKLIDSEFLSDEEEQQLGKQIGHF
jgi:hypothetical protein